MVNNEYTIWLENLANDVSTTESGLPLNIVMPCFSDEQITDKAITYAKDFKIWGNELETAKIKSNAVRDYCNGFKDAFNKA
jgi:hypothetical protein